MLLRNTLMFILTITLLWVTNVDATIIQAKSCSQSDVQAAIDTAAAGDTVKIPEGSCTWETHVSITEKIVLAGMDSTIITRSPRDVAIISNQSGVRITGLKLIEGQITIDGDDWRIDNCFIHTGGTAGVWARGSRVGQHPTGLIDHCNFYNTKILVTGRYSFMCNDQWAMPLSLGTGNAVYVEDNVFVRDIYGNVLDSNFGARWVFRYNTVTDAHIEAHSIQATTRGVRSWEIYNNTFNQVTRTMWVPMRLRSGTGVVFNNTLTGKWSSGSITLDNRRSCEDLGDGGLCDGSSQWDGNMTGLNGYACRDQIGRSTDAWLWTEANPYPPQALDPAHSWNNKHGLDSVDFKLYDGCTNTSIHIQSGRDYFNNTEKPGYTPYTYPHPLISLWGSTGNVPSAPKTFRIVRTEP